MKPIDTIQSYFNEHSGEEFLSVDDFADNKYENIDRIDKHHFVSRDRRITIKLNRYLTPIQRRIGIHRLKKDDMNNFSKGMNWASLTHSFVLCLLREQEKINRLCAFSICSDELYKQIIFKIHQNKFQLHKILKSPPKTHGVPRYTLEAKATMHWADWGRGNPYVFRETDFEELIRSPYMFARKFSSLIDKNIIDKLYKYVLSYDKF